MIHEATAKRLIRIYATTDDTDRRRGAEWYEREAEWLTQLGQEVDPLVPSRHVLSIYAALSPQMPWERNRRLTRRVLERSPYPGGVFKRSWERATLAVQEGPTALGGPKVLSFDCNLAGCKECLTLDVHMHKIAKWPLSGSYEILSDTYRAAARRCGALPSEFQATLWLFGRPPRPGDPDERLT